MRILLWMVMLSMVSFCGCAERRSSSPPVTIGISPERKAPGENPQALQVKKIEPQKSAFKTEWTKVVTRKWWGPIVATVVTGRVIEVSYFDGNTLIRFEDGDYAVALGYILRAVPGRLVKIEGCLDEEGCLTCSCEVPRVIITEFH